MRWLIYAAALAAGLGVAFRPTLESGFARLQTDPGDTLLNLYILEHSWQWLTRADYCGTYWSPPFFHPQPGALAYSENLLGTAPVYWALRPACEPVLAFQLWMMLVSALTFAGMAWALRRLGVGHLLCAAGGFAFAFGLPRTNQINHQQLLPHLFAPLAVLALWRFLQVPRTRLLAGLVAAVVMQVLASVYLGWFLGLGLAVFAALMLLADRAALGRLAEYGRAEWPRAAAVLFCGGLALAAALAPYKWANAGFRRHAADVQLPERRSWLTPPADSPWAGPLAQYRRGQDHERTLFCGFGVHGLFALAAITALASGGASAPREHEITGRSRTPARQERVFLFAAAGTAAVLVLLSLRWHGGGSAWWWVHKYVPGAGAIRAVPRVVLTAELFALLAGLFALDRTARRVPFGLALAAALAVLVMAEQWRTAPPSFDPAPFFAEVDGLRPRLEASGPAYVPLAPGRPYHVSQLVAMWAGLRANVPVVNGYSGRYPTGYPDWGRSMTDQELTDWLNNAECRVQKAE